tara:strand:+ start:169 stop:462 length:294 start_codon:yes stop_codon:yes gene_type:complete
MNWFIVVYFFVNGSWEEADKINKEGWSPILQPNYIECVEKINESNDRFKKIADYREVELDIKFKCECRENKEHTNAINCKTRNWFKKLLDKININLS